MASARAERRLAAILAADVVGYSRLIELDENATLAALRDLRREVIDALLAEYRGRIVKLMGDGALAEFGSVVDAVLCARAVQAGVAARQAQVPPERRIVFRIGINLGDVVVEGEDLFGDGVNIAARLEQLCEPGGVLISGTAYDHLQGKVTVPVEFVGEQKVKNIARPIRTYRIRPEDHGTERRLRLFASGRRYRAPIIMAAAIMMGALAMGWFIFGQRDAAPLIASLPSTAPSIAVLPFQNYGGSEADERLASGLTEDLITDLARFKNLAVIARNSTEVYKNKAVDVRQVGRDLNVHLVLEGSLQRQGDTIRINTQLIDTHTGEHVWSERFDRPVRDVFAVQSEISDRVANVLGGALGVVTLASAKAVKRKPPRELAAYELFLLGQELRSRGTDDSLRQAIDLYNKAIEKDPSLARAYAASSFAYHLLWRRDENRTDLKELRLTSAEKAVELDPGDPYGYYAMANAYGVIGRFSDARAAIDRILQLSPNSIEGLNSLSDWASPSGEAEAGARAADRAIGLNPNYGPLNARQYRFAYFMARRYQDVLTVMTRIPEQIWWPGDYVMFASSLAALGRQPEAEAVVQRALARYALRVVTERFLGAPDWAPHEREQVAVLMKAAGFPMCSPDQDPSGNPVTPPERRLPECVGATP